MATTSLPVPVTSVTLGDYTWGSHTDADPDGSSYWVTGTVVATVTLADRNAQFTVTFDVNDSGEFECDEPEVEFEAYDTAEGEDEEKVAQALTAAVTDDLVAAIAAYLDATEGSSAADSASDFSYDEADSASYSRDPDAYYGVKNCF